MRALTLLAYLAVNPDAVPRKRAAFVLWPDDDEASALANLRRHLALLEAALPPPPDREPWIKKDRIAMQWLNDGRAAVDAARFEALSADSYTHPEAVALYCGDFLEGVADDEWVVAHRDRLREQQMGLLSSLVARHRASGDAASAIQYAEQALRVDPWREDIVREIIGLRRDLGDAAGALAEYRRFREWLKAELDVEPMAETIKVAETLALPANGPRAGAARVPRDPARAAKPTNNLPRQSGRLIGRTALVESLSAALTEWPLVTLTGAGGVGKTRLSICAGAEVLGSMEDGVWFVDLAPLRDATLVPNAVAAALGLIEVKGTPMLTTLKQYAASRKLLIVLDNCEHVVDEVARVASALLAVGPDVRFLATSREALNVSGESIYEVPPLNVPVAGIPLSASEAAGFDAIALFVNRAAASDARFRLTDETAPVVADICRRLDGLPLAIELAAARVRALGLRAVLERLTQRFSVLTGGKREAQPRQQTMYALIDWSHELLTERERIVFRRLAVFVGGWSLEAACDVCADEQFGTADVVDLLAALVSKSLVVAEEGEAAHRYRFLESTRQFALDRLEVSEEHPKVAQRHLGFCVRLASEFDAGWLSQSDEACFALINPDLDNLRSALTWGLWEGNDVVKGAMLAVRCERLWTIALFLEGRRWLTVALNRLDSAANPELAAHVLGALFQVLPDGSERLEIGARAIAALRAAQSDVCLARVLSAYGHLIGQLGRTEHAVAAIEEAVAIARHRGDRRDAGNALALLAVQKHQQGDLIEAHTLLSAALSLQEAAGSRSGQAYALYLLAELEFARADVAGALAAAARAQDLLRMMKSEIRVLGVNGSNMAAYAIAADDFEAATGYAREALVNLQDMEDLVVLPLEHIAVIEGLCGRLATATRLAGFTSQVIRRLGMQRGPTERAGFERLEALLSQQSRDDGFDRQMALGAEMTRREALDLAFSQSLLPDATREQTVPN